MRARSILSFKCHEQHPRHTNVAIGASSACPQDSPQAHQSRTFAATLVCRSTMLQMHATGEIQFVFFLVHYNDFRVGCIPLLALSAVCTARVQCATLRTDPTTTTEQTARRQGADTRSLVRPFTRPTPTVTHHHLHLLHPIIYSPTKHPYGLACLRHPRILPRSSLRMSQRMLNHTEVSTELTFLLWYISSSSLQPYHTIPC